MHDSASDTLSLRADLHRALEHQELRLEYQPIVEMGNAGVVGFEALVRWDHPQRGPLTPDRFVALAETSGLILPLGAWVLGEATAALHRIQVQSGRSDLTMSVNVSPPQLHADDFVAVVDAALQSSGIDASRLILEVTENVVLSGAEMVVERLSELRLLGVRIALDDFGTGFSSLGYLERLPLDVLKIDRGFVASVTDVDTRSTIVGAIAFLAAGLGLTTVAEGIETLDHFKAMQTLGCDRGQGYLFSPPLPEAATVELLDTDAVLSEFAFKP